MHQSATGICACKICQFLVFIAVDELTVGPATVISMMIYRFVAFGLKLALAADNSINAVDILTVVFLHCCVFLDEDVVLIP